MPAFRSSLEPLANMRLFAKRLDTHSAGNHGAPTRVRRPVPARIQWMNLAMPGAGLIWLGPAWLGVTLALFFSATANLALISALIAPLDMPVFWRNLAVGAAATSYLASQLALSGRWRRMQALDAGKLRRERLLAVQRELANQSPETALDALEPLLAQSPDDLLLRFRIAQIAQLAAVARPADATRAAAQEAWRQLRLRDRHKIYQAQIQQHLTE